MRRKLRFEKKREKKETFGRMFGQQVARGGRRIGQMARSGQQSPLAAIRGAGQRRCYAEAAQGEYSLDFFLMSGVRDVG